MIMMRFLTEKCSELNLLSFNFFFKKKTDLGVLNKCDNYEHEHG